MLVLFFLAGGKSGLTLAAGQAPRVVVLNSYHQGEDWSDNLLFGLLGTLEKVYPFIEPAIEHLDTKRFPDADHLMLLKSFLASKYHGRKVDLVMALDNSALTLLLANRDELFPGVPVVFAGINGFRPEMLQGQEKITGVAEVQDIAGTLNTALGINPELKKVMMIIDYTSSGLAVKDDCKAILPQFKDRIAMEFAPDVPFSELKDKLKSLSRDSAALLLTYVTDSAGRTFSRVESTRLISEACPVPLYANHETRLGYGIVGGMILDGREHGKQAARIALRVLSGENPADIPVEKSFSPPMFDFLQLSRFHIPVSVLPPNSVVINRPVTFYDRHYEIIIPVSLVVGILSALLLLLYMTQVRLKRTGHQLQNSQEKYRILVEHANEAIVVIQDARFKFYNSKALELTGYEDGQYDGLNFGHIIHPDDLNRMMARYKDRLAGQVFESGTDFRILEKSGHSRWVHANSVLIDWEGKPATLNLIMDIAERKKAEEALRDSEQRFRQLAENIQEVFWIASPDWETIYYISPAYQNTWGKNIKALYDRPLSWLEAIIEEDREMVASMMPREIDAYDPEYIFPEFRVFFADGSLRWIFARAYPIRDDHGYVYRIAGIAEDITERKRAEERVKASLKEKEVLIQEIHHRVKNNMQVIISLLKIQAERSLRGEDRDMLLECQGRVYAMAAVHETLHQSDSMAEIDLKQYVTNLVTTMVQSYAIDWSKVRLNMEIGDIKISLDQATPLGLVMNELVSNSLKYAFPHGREGEIHITAKSNKHFLELCIRDNGIGFSAGIDWQDLKSLGLQIVRTLVMDQLDGRIELNSNSGAAFFITLPLE